MIQLTSRDDAMLEWLGVVRIAEMDAIRYALEGTNTLTPLGIFDLRRVTRDGARDPETVIGDEHTGAVDTFLHAAKS